MSAFFGVINTYVTRLLYWTDLKIRCYVVVASIAAAFLKACEDPKVPGKGWHSCCLTIHFTKNSRFHFLSLARHQLLKITSSLFSALALVAVKNIVVIIFGPPGFFLNSNRSCVKMRSCKISCQISNETSSCQILCPISRKKFLCQNSCQILSRVFMLNLVSNIMHLNHIVCQIAREKIISQISCQILTEKFSWRNLRKFDTWPFS